MEGNKRLLLQGSNRSENREIELVNQNGKKKKKKVAQQKNSTDMQCESNLIITEKNLYHQSIKHLGSTTLF